MANYRCTCAVHHLISNLHGVGDRQDTCELLITNASHFRFCFAYSVCSILLSWYQASYVSGLKKASLLHVAVLILLPAI